jgi:hypothetical protein
MPESVTNRCTKSHEHIFLLAKGEEYYYDAIAVQELSKHGSGVKSTQFAKARTEPVPDTKNKRDVWIVPTRGYLGAHFAVFSSELITPCILAGTSEHGCCAACGRPWERVVVKTGGVSPGLTGGEYAPPGQSPHSNARDGSNRDRSFNWSRNGLLGSNSTLDGTPSVKETVGWRKVCGCQTNEVVSAVVLDPFVGSGTTVATSLQLGRYGVGIDLSETYLRENAIPRIEEVMSGGRMRPATVVVPEGAPPTLVKLRGT